MHFAVDFAEVVAAWQNAHAVCFDVDSTVCEDEGIDELAAFCGAGEAVAAWTARSEGLSHSVCRAILSFPSISDILPQYHQVIKI